MNRNELEDFKKESEYHLVNVLLPFWVTRIIDNINERYLTHFDKNGMDPGEDEK